MRRLLFLVVLLPSLLHAQSKGTVQYWQDTITVDNALRPRTIRVYLPPNYSKSKEKFPVLYMMDGQNLFADSTSFAGEWRVDETLDSLYKTSGIGVIVVGIDNGGEDRIGEYTPWPHEKYGGGDAQYFGNYLMNHLKPKIDKRYRTRKKDNAILGSSLGANLSLHMILTYPKTFKKAGLLSPAYWFNPQFEAEVVNKKRIKARMYTLMGTAEDEDAFKKFQALSALIKEKSMPGNMEIRWIENGEHNEHLWSSQLGKCIAWLYAE